ncbi:MAG: AAA family ATPase, partial [Desulfobacula sp.]|nr:AAA family ATPase [Desulfobacula sp.]
MLSELAIKNFAIIDDIRISFKDGFSVLTGETGAGKSIIIEAVNLLLGARASADLVRAGCKNAELEAFFDIDAHSSAAMSLEEQGMDGSDGLIIRRVIALSGKSRVFINSRQSTLDLLKQVTSNLAGISSQH